MTKELIAFYNHILRSSAQRQNPAPSELSVKRSAVDLIAKIEAVQDKPRGHINGACRCGFGGVFIDGRHQTVIKAFDNKCGNRDDSKWQMMESEEAATEGEEGEDDVPTGPWLTLVARSATTCMLFIGKTHACYFRAFITAGASFFFWQSYVWCCGTEKKGKRLIRFWCRQMLF